MGMMKREHWDNVVALFPPEPETLDPLGMIQNADWWERRSPDLQWEPIATYRMLGDTVGEDAILRAADGRWTYGWMLDGRWSRLTEGASWPLPGFHPVEWARPMLEDAIALAAE